MLVTDSSTIRWKKIEIGVEKMDFYGHVTSS